MGSNICQGQLKALIILYDSGKFSAGKKKSNKRPDMRTKKIFTM